LKERGTRKGCPKGAIAKNRGVIRREGETSTNIGTAPTRKSGGKRPDKAENLEVQSQPTKIRARKIRGGNP